MLPTGINVSAGYLTLTFMPPTSHGAGNNDAVFEAGVEKAAIINIQAFWPGSSIVFSCATDAGNGTRARYVRLDPQLRSSEPQTVSRLDYAGDESCL